MALAPVHRLKKAEIVRLASMRCKAHGHTYLTHYSCYQKDFPGTEERVGFLDLECSNLKPDYGIVLCYCIKDGGTDQIDQGVLTASDIKKAKSGEEDKRVVEACIKDMLKYDRVVTFYGKRFDLPFLRSRAVMNGSDFPPYGTMKHTDMYDIAKRNFNLSSRRLENCCRNLLGHTDKTRIENAFWRGAVRGDKESLAYVLDHCIHDVVDLEKLYEKTKQYSKHTDSIL